VLLPTPGMAIESRLGKCSGCEDYLERSRAIELRRLSAVADKEEHEAARLKARLDAMPPQLENDEIRLEPLRVELNRTT
jgi:hypothetical protein